MGNASLVIMIMSGPDDGRKIYLSRQHGDGDMETDGTWTVVFGRREECDVSIPFDTQVSRQHAMLKIMPDGEMWLVDAESLNGTFVGKARVEKPTILERDCLFRVGRTWLRIQPEMEETT